MNNLKSRVKKIENQVGGEVMENGIPKWAFDYAMEQANFETSQRPHFKKLWEIVNREIGEEKEMPERRFKTRADIENFARQLAEKYTSLEDYKKNPPKPDKKTIAIMDEVIRRCG